MGSALQVIAFMFITSLIVAGVVMHFRAIDVARYWFGRASKWKKSLMDTYHFMKATEDTLRAELEVSTEKFGAEAEKVDRALEAWEERDRQYRECRDTLINVSANEASARGFLKTTREELATAIEVGQEITDVAHQVITERDALFQTSKASYERETALEERLLNVSTLYEAAREHIEALKIQLAKMHDQFIRDREREANRLHAALDLAATNAPKTRRKEKKQTTSRKMPIDIVTMMGSSRLPAIGKEAKRNSSVNRAHLYAAKHPGKRSLNGMRISITKTAKALKVSK